MTAVAALPEVGEEWRTTAEGVTPNALSGVSVKWLPPPSPLATTGETETGGEVSLLVCDWVDETVEPGSGPGGGLRTLAFGYPADPTSPDPEAEGGADIFEGAAPPDGKVTCV